RGARARRARASAARPWRAARRLAPSLLLHGLRRWSCRARTAAPPPPRRWRSADRSLRRTRFAALPWRAQPQRPRWPRPQSRGRRGAVLRPSQDRAGARAHRNSRGDPLYARADRLSPRRRRVCHPHEGRYSPSEGGGVRRRTSLSTLLWVALALALVPGLAY